MYEHNPEWTIDMTQSEMHLRRKHCRWLLGLALWMFANGAANGADHQHIAKVEDRLAMKVENINNRNKPLIATLLGIAADYHLPMGIERVVKEAVEVPIMVTVEHGTVASLLDACIRQVPGYSWSIRDGTVHVYGAEELNRPSDLFNLVIASFE